MNVYIHVISGVSKDKKSPHFGPLVSYFESICRQHTKYGWKVLKKCWLKTFPVCCLLGKGH